MESAEPSGRDEARDDQFDVGVRKVMAEVHEARRPVTEGLREHQRRAPVLHDGRVEGGLVGLVLGEELPRCRHVGVDLPQSVEHAFERPAKVRLPGEVGAVGEPDRDGLRAERHADVDDVADVGHRLRPHGRVGVRKGAELVGVHLPRLVLESVRVDRVEAEA